MNKNRQNSRHNSEDYISTSTDLNLKIVAKEGSKFGRGVFAVSNIRAGEVICQMQGPIISRDEHIKKYGSLMYTDPFQIAEDRYIDLIEPYRSFNHSCEPNAGVREDGVVFALSNIMPGEEIFYDYSTTCFEPDWFMDCGCAAETCRKRIASFETIPASRRDFYFKNNATLGYIRELFFK